jgi:hypothetical protein
MRRVPPSVVDREDLNRLLAGGVDEGMNIISELVDTVTRLVVQELHEAEQFCISSMQRVAEVGYPLVRGHSCTSRFAAIQTVPRCVRGTDWWP